MCGIAGFFGFNDAYKRMRSALDVIKARGRDFYGYYDGKKTEQKNRINELSLSSSENIIGHCLHNIVSFVKQPLQGKGVLASNNEIYNWESLCEKHKIEARNDSELIIKLIEKIGLVKSLDELDGVYAFAYWDGSKVYLARDLIGVKPVWYSIEGGFSFASEGKALENPEELNPRSILVYDIKTRNIKFIPRKFFSTKPEFKKNKESLKKELLGLLANAIAKRIPDQKFGVLFSGGIDSLMLALICKELGADFTCYTSALEEKGMSAARDLEWAKKSAKYFGFELKVKTLNLQETEKLLKETLPQIEDSNVVKAGVAITFNAACKLAKKDSIKVIMSGLGSEEIFAGYERHKKSPDINKECVSGLLKMYERDLYRDDVITMHNNLELRVPFLDKSLVEYALKVSAKHKIRGEIVKLILREIALDIGVPKEFAMRKKIAAQYGSKFDRAIEKLTKINCFRKKSEYLEQFYQPRNVKLAALISSGKDSVYAAWTMQNQNYGIKCFVTIESRNQDSFMYHTPNIKLAKMQAETSGIPIIIEKTPGEKEKELLGLRKALKKAKEYYGVQGVVTGALWSNYQRERVEKIADELGLKVFAPLWHIDQETLMRRLLKDKFEVIISSIAADGLDDSWLGRRIDEKMIDELRNLHQKNKIHIAFEGGEAETLVVNCPMFSRKIKVVNAEKIMENECTGRFVIKKAVLK